MRNKLLIKSNLLSLFLILGFFNLKAQTFEWAQSAGGAKQETVDAIVHDKDGNSYVTGTFLGTMYFKNDSLVSNPGICRDIFFAKYDPSGKLLWMQKAGSNKVDGVKDMLFDKKGNIYLIGDFFGQGYFESIGSKVPFGPGLFLSKFTSNGEILWARKIGKCFSNSQAAFDSDENLVIAGTFSDTTEIGGVILTSSYRDNDVFVAKIDTTGKCLWVKHPGNGIANPSEVLNSLAIDKQNNIYATGQGEGQYGSYNLSLGLLIIKYDTNGEVIWGRSFDVKGIDYDNLQVSTDSSGNCYVTGEFEDSAKFDNTLLKTNLYERQSYLTMLNPNGDVLWAKQIKGKSVGVRSIATDILGNVYLGGGFSASATFGEGGQTTTVQADPDKGNMFIAKYDNSGKLKWLSASTSSAGAQSISVINGYCYIGGVFTGPSCTVGNTTLLAYPPECCSYGDYFVAKLKDKDFVTLAPVQSHEVNIGITIFPNPTGDFINVHAISNSNINETAMITIYNAMGEIIKLVPVSMNKPDTRIDVSAFAKGIYYLRFECGEAIESRRIIIN